MSPGEGGGAFLTVQVFLVGGVEGVLGCWGGESCCAGSVVFLTARVIFAGGGVDGGGLLCL